MIQFFKVKLAEKNQLTVDVFEFIFELIDPSSIEFEAGQFMMLQVPQEGSFPQKRAYSIASPSYMKDKLRFCIKLIEGGCASTYLEALKIGDELSLQGAFGRFVVAPDCQKDLLFVATGTGLAPFYGLLEDLFAKGFDKKIELYFGVRSLDDVFYQDILKDLAAKHSNLSYEICVSRPEGDCIYSQGRVTDFFSAKNYSPQSTEVYLCGSGAMVAEVKEAFLTQGFDKAQIHQELFYV